MNFYRLWVLAFFLKFVGSAWDASYHFRYLFEKYSIPHIVNFSGFALGAFLLFLEWRQPRYMDRFSRNLTTIGYVLFLIGIPLDFSYHIKFGIDLTTWSPTHFIYYIATDIMILGVWRAFYLYKKGEKPSWKSLHTWFAMFLLECLVFPNMQQENGAISYFQYIHHQSIASKEILVLIKDPASQIFGGVPEWVYPTYSVLVVTLLTLVVIRLFKDSAIPLAATALYILCRFVGKTIFFAVNYPTSYVPITLLFIPLLFLLIKKHSWLAGLIGSVLYFIGLYLIHESGVLITPPMEMWFIAPVAIIGIVIGGIIPLIKRQNSVEQDYQEAARL
ncbi:hypothetical protein [Bacillus sp. FJAT-49736]|uniref:hypothetical protein n=1 Tax=Bacillus sp. FJAT-49736 TaxID=2833582 RepID=UPI001BC924E2|nr:hypothetical protein [Bacillus sp. FJAT-49736]MBS4172741.1 hypothetical protein [Bacillus sp. FJAT-49736]